MWQEWPAFHHGIDLGIEDIEVRVLHMGNRHVYGIHRNGNNIFVPLFLTYLISVNAEHINTIFVISITRLTQVGAFSSGAVCG